MNIRNCKKSNCKQKDSDGNCQIPGSDGLPIQCVGSWVESELPPQQAGGHQNIPSLPACRQTGTGEDKGEGENAIR